MKKLLLCSDSLIRENTAMEFITKIFTYNEKLDIKTLPKNYIGYDLHGNLVITLDDDLIKKGKFRMGK